MPHSESPLDCRRLDDRRVQDHVRARGQLVVVGELRRDALGYRDDGVRTTDVLALDADQHPAAHLQSDIRARGHLDPAQVLVRIIDPAHRPLGRAERRGEPGADAHHVKVVRVDQVGVEVRDHRREREFQVREPRVEPAPAAVLVDKPERVAHHLVRRAADRTSPEAGHEVVGARIGGEEVADLGRGRGAQPPCRHRVARGESGSGIPVSGPQPLRPIPTAQACALVR
jgi:hypothetical protein